MQLSRASATSLLASDQPSLSVAENSIHTPYVLIVDDDEAIVEVIQFLLETEECNGIGISDSLKVLPFLDTLSENLFPSVILLDLMMPRFSGYEIASSLGQHERYRRIPIIIMTADNRVQSVNDIRGAQDFVSKPFHLDHLIGKLKAYLDQPSR